MSFITFRQRCGDCQQEWNAAFGIVGSTYIAQPPTMCPHCGSPNLSNAGDGWDLSKVADASELPIDRGDAPEPKWRKFDPADFPGASSEGAD